MKQETENELFNLLYDLEDYLEYDETEIGKRVGEIINKLQNELLNK
jgi:hypothetical protein